MLTSAQVRQGFLDYFKKQQHTIVPSFSLMPTSPNLLFTVAGMAPFVPIFLGEVSSPYKPGRVADTQKCIRAGGKHNDLDDVGFDTYHHTFFEMLGNWSFGDYFKKESLNWGWELITKVWGFPPKRLFATVYNPDKSKGDPSEFDQEAYDIWAEIFTKAGLDPKIHIVNGNKKDNFWMMGDTGPCGPCSEIHVNLNLSDDEMAGRVLVNSSSPRCIEIWNHVFIQYNATADGKFADLPAKHVDTGMGFERVAGIIATTKGFTDFSNETSNYNSDLFTAIFDEVEKLSGKKYTRTVPAGREGLSQQEQIDVAFRVIADHIRCVSCAIADGILPSNEGRNYVIRRILRRAIMYARKLDLKIGDLAKLSGKVVETLGGIFPELKRQQEIIAKVILGEEESFGKTLARGIQQFEKNAAKGKISGPDAFELYDTYGFPLDLTEVLATERGLTVDKAGFEVEMEKQRDRARSSQKKSDVTVQSGTSFKTKFVGYEEKNLTGYKTKVLSVGETKNGHFIITESSPFYAEMGGQVGDSGTLEYSGKKISIIDTKTDASGQQLHLTKDSVQIPTNAEVILSVDLARRAQIQKHHTATHLLDWALREKLGSHIRQAGSMVSSDRLRFDFSHFSAVEADVLKTMETEINAKIAENTPVKTFEVPFAQKPADVVAVFGEKYGDVVRVVDVGGYSKELCGGTHVNATGEIGFFKILSESAIAAGTRRIEALVGAAAVNFVQHQTDAIKLASSELNSSVEELPVKIAQLKTKTAELEHKIKILRQKELVAIKDELIAKAKKDGALTNIRAVVKDCNNDDLKTLSQMILSEVKEGSVVLGSAFEGKANVLAAGSKEALAKGFNAGEVIKDLTAKLDGKGGGKPDLAQGSGKAIEKLSEVIS